MNSELIGIVASDQQQFVIIGHRNEHDQGEAENNQENHQIMNHRIETNFEFIMSDTLGNHAQDQPEKAENQLNDEPLDLSIKRRLVFGPEKDYNEPLDECLHLNMKTRHQTDETVLNQMIPDQSRNQFQQHFEVETINPVIDQTENHLTTNKVTNTDEEDGLAGIRISNVRSLGKSNANRNDVPILNDRHGILKDGKRTSGQNLSFDDKEDKHLSTKRSRPQSYMDYIKDGFIDITNAHASLPSTALPPASVLTRAFERPVTERYSTTYSAVTAASVPSDSCLPHSCSMPLWSLPPFLERNEGIVSNAQPTVDEEFYSVLVTDSDDYGPGDLRRIHGYENTQAQTCPTDQSSTSTSLTSSSIDGNHCSHFLVESSINALSPASVDRNSDLVNNNQQIQTRPRSQQITNPTTMMVTKPILVMQQNGKVFRGSNSNFQKARQKEQNNGNNFETKSTKQPVELPNHIDKIPKNKNYGVPLGHLSSTATTPESGQQGQLAASSSVDYSDSNSLDSLNKVASSTSREARYINDIKRQQLVATHGNNFINKPPLAFVPSPTMTQPSPQHPHPQNGLLQLQPSKIVLNPGTNPIVIHMEAGRVVNRENCKTRRAGKRNVASRSSLETTDKIGSVSTKNKIQCPLPPELMSSLQVVRVHQGSFYKFSRETVEVRPMGFPDDAPTLLAFRDKKGEIQIDWSLSTNRKVATKLMKLLEKLKSSSLSSSSSSHVELKSKGNQGISNKSKATRETFNDGESNDEQ